MGNYNKNHNLYAKSAKNGFIKSGNNDNFADKAELDQYINKIVHNKFSFLDDENVTKNQSILTDQEKEYLKIARNWTINAYNDIQYNRFIPDNFYSDTINDIVDLLKEDQNLDLKLTADIKRNIQIEAITNKLNADNPDYFTKDDDKKYLNKIIVRELDSGKEPKDIVKEVNLQIKKINEFAKKQAKDKKIQDDKINDIINKIYQSNDKDNIGFIYSKQNFLIEIITKELNNKEKESNILTKLNTYINDEIKKINIEEVYNIPKPKVPTEIEPVTDNIIRLLQDTSFYKNHNDKDNLRNNLMNELVALYNINNVSFNNREPKDLFNNKEPKDLFNEREPEDLLKYAICMATKEQFVTEEMVFIKKNSNIEDFKYYSDAIEQIISLKYKTYGEHILNNNSKEVSKDIYNEVMRIILLDPKKPIIKNNVTNQTDSDKPKQIVTRSPTGIEDVFTNLCAQQNPPKGSNFRGHENVKPRKRHRFLGFFKNHFSSSSDKYIEKRNRPKIEEPNLVERF